MAPTPSATLPATETAAHAVPAKDITRMLVDWSQGDEEALERLVPLIYDDLRRLAQSYLDRESPGHTLQATAVVHELYVRLTGQEHVCWQNRAQFFAVAATMMRRILVSHARHKHAAKRGGRTIVLALDEALGVPSSRDPEILALDDALRALAEFAPRQSRIVELRFFSGLSIDEVAAVLGVSAATVSLDWSLARAWLFRQLNRG